MSAIAAGYVAPQTRYVVPAVSQRDDIRLSEYRVEGSVKSSSDGVRLENCIVEGSVSAREKIECIHTFSKEIVSTSDEATVRSKSMVEGGVRAREIIVISDSSVTGSVTSSSEGVTVKDGSRVSGAVTAREDIVVSGGSAVGGDVISASSGVKIRDSSFSSGLVEAREELSIINSKLSEGATIQSTSGGVDIHTPKRQPAIVAKVLAREDVNLSWLSCGEVSSSSGKVTCLGGKFGLVRSGGSPTLKQAEIGTLELTVEKGKEITVDLTGSVVKAISIKVEDAASNSATFGGNGSSKAISGRNIVWTLNGSTLTASPQCFMVQGVLLNQFKQDLLTRCQSGTKGMVNGVPAQVTNTGIEIQQKVEGKRGGGTSSIVTKVTIVGGKILGNITQSEPVKFDTTKTEFLGRISS